MTPVEQQHSLTSSNPVLSRPQFRRRGGQKTVVMDQGAGIVVPWGRTGPGQDTDPLYGDGPAPLPLLVADLMTMDDVVHRAAAGLTATALAAALSWALLAAVPLATGAACGAVAGAALVAATLLVLQCRRNRPSPALSLTFAAFQGVFLGVFSGTVAHHAAPGLLVQTVLGSMAASAGSLLAHRLHWIRAGRRFRPLVGAGLLALSHLALADWLLLPDLGADGLGLRPVGLGVFMGLVGVVLATPMLSLHFRKVEDAIDFGASRGQAWVAAFGVTLTLTWLYVEIVRLLTLFPAEDVY
ncbi:Bax inhibitor-1/YccA family protein [Streptomyces sp. NPDC005799]|uniref:Bax inhibitor-1/YccA family membrane protein n=1 Tax=Streptomyces sp. NPDC005799 TaxID=3154678 RepID=UPI0033FC1040